MAQSELHQRGLEQLKAGNYEEARRLFREYGERTGTTAETQALLRQAENLLSAGDMNGAAPLYARVLERNPSLHEVYLGLVRIGLATQQIDAARIHARAAVKLAPGNSLAWALRGLVNEAGGDLEAALGDLRRAVELAPSDFLGQYNYGRLLAVSGSPVEGIAPLLQATRLEPRNADALYVLGKVCHKAGQSDEARRALEQATQLTPRRVDAWATLGDVLFGQKKFKEARGVFDQGLARCGDHPVLLEKALATAMLLSDAQGAIDYVERELKVVPHHEQGWINLAQLTLANGEPERSEAAARELLKNNPRNWEAWYHLGNLYEAGKKTREAEETYRKAVECAPGNWKPLNNLGMLLLELQEPKKNAEGVALLERTLPLTPRGELRPHYNLALGYTKLGQREKALPLAHRVATEAPANTSLASEARRLETELKTVRH